MKLIRTGITRDVFLLRHWAIKVPTLRYGWRFFLQGLLANIQEQNWWQWTDKDPRLCPVLYGNRAGLCVVMRRCTPIREEDLPARSDYEGLPLDYKADSFGWLEGRIVLTDYGS